MKKFTLIIFLILNTFIFPSALNRDIDIIDMPLHEVLAVLSKEIGKNLICSKEAKDIVIDTYFNKGEDVNSVLQFLAESYDLSIKKENNTTIFMLQSEKNTKKAKIIGKITSNNIALKNAKIELKDLNKVVYTDNSGNFIIDNIPKDVYVCKISKKGYEERGEIIDTVKSINVLNVDLKENQNNYENKDISDDLSNSNFYEIDGKFYYTKTFSLFNVSPDEVSKILHETFGENIKVSTLSKVNKLVVSAERDILENAISIIEDIDKNPKQVKITSQILDISNNLFEELGFDWVYKQNVESQERNSLTAMILNKAGVNGVGSTVNIVRQFHNKSDVLSTGINLLEATNDLVVSSVPTLMIASGEEGEFKVTEEVVVGIKTHREDKKDRYSEPIFKEAGLIMKVKPFIKDNDYIILEISLELSDFKFKKNVLNLKDINSGTYNSEGGSKVGRGLTTKVRVKNGDTILLGGLKKSIQQNIESKIPILGDIPIISFFFKNTTKKNENSDMYIKLKVEIDE
ncbi:carboxypeptidase-like regulatory domain-containing protein [Fusobacterium animalis]|uniref:secretin N-terminal domain-containing protein n=1 Tax=Fusobacterium animalis TaxID=76859 RepID=UPI0030CC9134